MSTITQRHSHCTRTCMRARIDITQACISLRAHAQQFTPLGEKEIASPNERLCTRPRDLWLQFCRIYR